MKRSEINALLRDAEQFIASHGWHLPPFAQWHAEEWRRDIARPALEAGLGWDVTDFGLGDFQRVGLLLFALRNGRLGGKPYAEKLLVVNEGQVTPMHFHWSKTEDIINRGGGVLALRLAWASDDESGLSERPVEVETDGAVRSLAAREVLRLSPGESVTLVPKLYHEFWAEGARVLVGEVSSVNDDATDNRFLEPVGRFPSIKEDEAPYRLLVNDVRAALGAAK